MSTGPSRQRKLQLRPPAPPYYRFPRGKSIIGVISGVLLWADMNTATPLGAWGHSVLSHGRCGQTRAMMLTPCPYGPMNLSRQVWADACSKCMFNSKAPTCRQESLCPCRSYTALNVNAAGDITAMPVHVTCKARGLVAVPRTTSFASFASQPRVGTRPSSLLISYVLTTFPFIQGSPASHVFSSVHIP